jgi:hypothetical protein
MDSGIATPSPTLRSTSRGRITSILVLAGLILATTLRTWLPESMRSPWLTAEAAEPYQELTAGLLAGHLYLPRAPDSRLTSLTDPYDPALNAPYRIPNLSYYRGHYYLYLGIAPALTLFLPVHLLTGLYLTQHAAIAILCGLGSAAGLWMLCWLRRQFLPHCPGSLLAASAGAWLFADGYQSVLGSGAPANGVAIAGGYAFALLALAASTRGAVSNHRWAWLTLSGLSWGLAVASRPNYLFAALGAGYLVAVHTEPYPSQRTDRAYLNWAALGLPFGGVVVTLLLYNSLRFSQPFEFGQRYMLGGWNQIHLATLGFRSALENIRYYLWRPNHLAAFFPFLQSPDDLATGIVCNAPWLWLAPAAGWAWATSQRSSPARALGSAALVLGAANLLTLILLPSGDPSGVLVTANGRYVFDFQPGLALFVCIGALLAGHQLAADRPWRRGLSCGSALLAAVSILAALSLQFQHLPPESYRPLAAILNQPVLLYDRRSHQAYGPIAFDVTFPMGRYGQTEPLVDTGRTGASDLVYVQYLDATHARFGLARDGAGGPLSEPIQLDFTTRHRLEVWIGSLLPPAGDPAAAHLSEAESIVLKRLVRVVLDGRRVLNDVADCHPASAREVWVGSCPVTPWASRARFGGTVGPAVRLPLTGLARDRDPPEYGDLELEISLPNPVPHTPEPMLTSGVAGAADIIYLDYPATGRIQIGYDHWGHSGVLSPQVAINPSVPHRIIIHLGSLHRRTSQHLQPRSGVETLPPGVRVTIDGNEVLSAPTTAYPSSPFAVAIGRNPIGASTCSYAFTGKIIAVRRLTEPAPPSPPDE